jgi:hypothetical protein
MHTPTSGADLLYHDATLEPVQLKRYEPLLHIDDAELVGAEAGEPVPVAERLNVGKHLVCRQFVYGLHELLSHPELGGGIGPA